MRKESFIAATAKIKDFFLNNSQQAYTTYDLTQIFKQNRTDWKIASYRNQYHFMSYLNEADILRLVKLNHLSSYTEKKIYIKHEATNYHIAQTIKKDGYLSHYSAMYNHQLTLQIPKTIYLSYDKYAERHLSAEVTLKQDAIDKAFSKPQRITSEAFRSENDRTRFFFLQRKSHSIDVGVVRNNDIRITDMERTLIDISIRPSYSGGVFEVLNAFKISKTDIDLEKLNSYLLELNYIYPYHQLLGFYLERAGFDRILLSNFYNRISKFNFYLTYNLTNKKFDEVWKIYYPNGF